MKKSVFVFLLFSRSVFPQTYSLNKVNSGSNSILYVKHTFYEIGFNTKYHLPAWTFYSLTKAHLELADLERAGSFVKDPLLNAEQAKSNDYSASGFDKGHMVPCEDMSFSEQAMHETFYYSNCAPQTTELNRGEWKVLEELSRQWGKEYGEVIVISGPVFQTNMRTMVSGKNGANRIPIPDSFYKIIVRHESQTYKAIGFILPNSAKTLDELPNYVCSVDSIEKITALDFFTDLPDNIEAQFESVVTIKDWDFDHHHTIKTKNDSIAKTNLIAVQCSATTKKGKRCLNKTISADHLCGQHSKK
jgi:endonuclease G